MNRHLPLPNFVLKLFASLILIISYGISTAQDIDLGAVQVFSERLQLKQRNAKGDETIRLRVEVDKTIDVKINYSKLAKGTSTYLVGETKEDEGSFFIHTDGDNITGNVILKGQKIGYEYYADDAGNTHIRKVDLNKLLCIEYDAPDHDHEGHHHHDNEGEDHDHDHEVGHEREVALIPGDLQSFPGARGCVLLDFDGHYVSGTPWNNGNPINAAHSGMSDAAIIEAWEVVSEDFRPFHLNITTSESVFNSYPKNRRMRCIATTTKTAAPTAGGVAYIGSFNWNDDTPCWGFVLGGKSCGEVCSHEIGHTFDLGHDGRHNPEEGYFGGHGDWAPIMGVGYYEPITQWSKGEYNSANNQQNDLATIAQGKFGVGYRDDDHSGAFGSATALQIFESGEVPWNNYGVIERNSDIDAFHFTTSGGGIDLQVNTVNRHGNLNIVAKLYNESGAEIAASNLGNLNARIQTNIAAGKYYLTVDGVGAGSAQWDGYSGYASLGQYWIGGYVPFGVIGPDPSTGLITVYEDCNYGGFSGGLSVGDYNLARLVELGVKNDDISSLRARQGYKAILYQDNNFTGASTEVNATLNCFNATWNDKVTSIRMRPNGTPNLNGSYYIQNRASGLVIEIENANTENGGIPRQQPRNNKPNQRFELTDRGDGSYSVIAQHSGKALDVADISTTSGDPIHQWEYVGGANQRFILVPTDNGFYKMIIEHDGMVLDVSTNNAGEQLHQWVNHGGANCQWRLIPVPEATTGLVTAFEHCNYNGFSGGLKIGDYNLNSLITIGIENDYISSLKVMQGYKAMAYQDNNYGGGSTTIDADLGCLNATWNDKITSFKVRPNGKPNQDGTYFIRNRASGLFVDVNGGVGATGNGATIIQSTFNGNENQQFEFTDRGDGSYSIIAKHSGRGMDVVGISTESGAGIHQWDYLGGGNQRFILYPTDEGYFKLIAEHTGMVAEVSTNDAGEQLHQWVNHNGANAEWVLVPSNSVVGAGDGLQANYFNGMDFESPVMSRVDEVIDFDWGNTSPGEGVSANQFTARWTGRLQAKTTAEYTIYLNSDNGRRLWVDGQLLIDEWQDDSGIDYSATVNLTAGQFYDIRVDYFENLGGANIELSWSSELLPREIIPQTQLVSNALPNSDITSPEDNEMFTDNESILIEVTSVDSDGDVDRVEIFVNGELETTISEAPYTYELIGAPIGSYVIHANAYDNMQAIASSEEVIVNVTAVTGLTFNKEEVFSIYPNPAADRLAIILTQEIDVSSVRVFDVHGRMVLEGSMSTASVDVSSLNSGVYSIELISQDKLYIKRFVKK